MAVVIVAIPNPDDYVWNISSEKIPHMTLCYLGDSVNNLSHVEDFIAHAVSTSLSKFGMDVDHRGVLGDSQADVLFFGTHGLSTIEQFRKNLLTDTDIFTAYNSADQHEVWTPHLTLGYPDSPANPDNREMIGIGWVNFDRIALWTGDFEGVEFPLKNDDALSMTTARGAAYLEHFGVKGMHWGQRKAEAIKGNAAVKAISSSEDHKRATQVRIKAKVAGVNTLSNKDLEDLLTRMNLETRLVSLKKVEHEQSLVGKGKKWAANFVTDVLKDAAASWIRRPGRDRGPVKVKSWTTGQQFANAIDGSVVEPKAIGR